MKSQHSLGNFRQRFSLDTVTKAYFNNNGFDEIGFYTILTNMPQLTFLDASGNNIKHLGRIPRHAHLQTLLLHNNQIQRLPLHTVCTRLASLKQLSLHNNLLTPESIIDLKHPNPSIEELWFDPEALDKKAIADILVACPRLTAEIMPNSNTVKMYYSKEEQQYELMRNDPCISKVGFYSLVSITAAAVGTVPAAITAVATYPHSQSAPGNFCDSNTFEECVGKYCAIFMPACAIAAPVCARIGLRIYGYCTTKPEDRYATVYTRNIAATPALLTLIKPENPLLDPDQEEMGSLSEIPDQEQEE